MSGRRTKELKEMFLIMPERMRPMRLRSTRKNPYTAIGNSWRAFKKAMERPRHAKTI